MTGSAHAATMVPHTRAVAYTTRSNAPLASRIKAVEAEAPPRAVAIIGLADDLGVRLNGGRPGAAKGPAAFREALSRYGVAEPEGFNWPPLFDAGDIVPAEGESVESLHETHRRVTTATRKLCELGYFPIAIGGGHDLTFPFVRGVIEHRRAGGLPELDAVLYIDPHLDVRAEPGSGMPFRSLVEQCGVARLINIGFSPLVNARTHAEWFRSHNGSTHQPSEAEAASAGLSSGALSFDLDALDMAFAPGVSAMNPSGLTAAAAEGIVKAISPERWATCADFMELSPDHDPTGRTARLAAHLFLTLLQRFSDLPLPSSW